MDKLGATRESLDSELYESFSCYYDFFNAEHTIIIAATLFQTIFDTTDAKARESIKKELIDHCTQKRYYCTNSLDLLLSYLQGDSSCKLMEELYNASPYLDKGWWIGYRDYYM